MSCSTTFANRPIRATAVECQESSKSREAELFHLHYHSRDNFTIIDKSLTCADEGLYYHLVCSWKHLLVKRLLQDEAKDEHKNTSNNKYKRHIQHFMAIIATVFRCVRTLS